MVVSLLDELGANSPDSVVVATDGSVSQDPPRSGWGAVLRVEGRTVQTYAGGTRLALSSLRAEIEAVTRALELTDNLSPAPRSLFVLTDSQSLLRRLETGLCPPEWLQRARRITWIYCPGHSGVVINEHADRLAGKTSETSDRICLGSKDIAMIMKNQHTSQDSEHECEREVGRMRGLGLKPGWAAGSRLKGRQRALACQPACGTLSRQVLSEVLRRRGAETAWRRLVLPPVGDQALVSKVNE